MNEYQWTSIAVLNKGLYLINIEARLYQLELTVHYGGCSLQGVSVKGGSSVSCFIMFSLVECPRGHPYFVSEVVYYMSVCYYFPCVVWTAYDD